MPWLPEAIDSLLAQTTPAFEILVVAGASDDGSDEYLRSVHDPRLRIIEQKTPGLTAALNQLIEEAHTPLLARMDADDVSYPARMEKLRAAIESHPDAGLLYSLADYHPRDRCAGRFRCSRGSTDELRSLVNRGYLLSFCHSTVLLNIEKVRASEDIDQISAPRTPTYGGGWRRSLRSIAFPKSSSASGSTRRA